MCELGIRLPYEQVSEVLKTMDIEMKARQIERIVDRHGQRATAQRDAELAQTWQAPVPVGRQPEGPDILYIEADGTWVNSHCELRGMPWYRDTADGICNLCALRFNPASRWQLFWQH